MFQNRLFALCSIENTLDFMVLATVKSASAILKVQEFTNKPCLDDEMMKPRLRNSVR